MFLGESITGSTVDHANFVAPSRLSRPSAPSQQDLNPYIIVDTQPHVEKIRGKKGQPYIEERGVMFTTRNKGKWFVIPPMPIDRLRRESSVPYLNGAGEALSERQRFNPVNPDEEPHTDNLLFLAANPERTARTVYYYNRPRVRIHNKLRSLVELDMNDLVIMRTFEGVQMEEICGRADHTLVGPDGQIIMTELGGSGFNRKSSQLTRHSLGVETVVRDANHGNVPPIKRFVGIYEQRRKNLYVLRIRPAVPDRVQEYAGAVVHPIFNAR